VCSSDLGLLSLGKAYLGIYGLKTLFSIARRNSDELRESMDGLEKSIGGVVESIGGNIALQKVAGLFKAINDGFRDLRIHRGGDLKAGDEERAVELAEKELALDKEKLRLAVLEGSNKEEIERLTERIMGWDTDQVNAAKELVAETHETARLREDAIRFLEEEKKLQKEIAVLNGTYQPETPEERRVIALRKELELLKEKAKKLKEIEDETQKHIDYDIKHTTHGTQGLGVSETAQAGGLANMYGTGGGSLSDDKLIEKRRKLLDTIAKMDKEAADAGIEIQRQRIEQEKQLNEQRVYMAVAYGNAIGQAIGHGFGKGAEGYGIALRGIIITTIDFLEQYAMAAILKKTLDAAFNWALVFKAAAEAAAITTALEGVKAGIRSFEPKPKGYASGTSFAPGGMAMVGEQGPELMNVPRGAQIYNNRETNNMMTGNTYNIYLPAGASRQNVRDITDEMEKLQRGGRLNRFMVRTMQYAGNK